MEHKTSKERYETFKRWAFQTEKKLDKLFESATIDWYGHPDGFNPRIIKDGEILSAESYLEYIDIIKQINNKKAESYKLQNEYDVNTILEFLSERVINDMASKDDAIRSYKWVPHYHDSRNVFPDNKLESIIIQPKENLEIDELIRKLRNNTFQYNLKYVFVLESGNSIELEIDPCNLVLPELKNKLTDLRNIKVADNYVKNKNNASILDNVIIDYAGGNRDNRSKLAQHLISSMSRNEIGPVEEYIRDSVIWTTEYVNVAIKKGHYHVKETNDNVNVKYPYEAFAKIFSSHNNTFKNKEVEKSLRFARSDLDWVRKHYNKKNDLLMDLRIAQDFGLETDFNEERLRNQLIRYLANMNSLHIHNFFKVYNGKFDIHISKEQFESILSLQDKVWNKNEIPYDKLILINPGNKNHELISQFNNSLAGIEAEKAIDKWNSFLGSVYSKLSKDDKEFCRSTYFDLYDKLPLNIAYDKLQESSYLNLDRYLINSINSKKDRFFNEKLKTKDFSDALNKFDLVLNKTTQLEPLIREYNKLYWTYATNKDFSSLIEDRQDKLVKKIFCDTSNHSFTSQLRNIEVRAENKDVQSNLCLSTPGDSITFVFGKDCNLELNWDYLNYYVLKDDELRGSIKNKIEDTIKKNNLYLINDANEKEHFNQVPFIFEGANINEEFKVLINECWNNDAKRYNTEQYEKLSSFANSIKKGVHHVNELDYSTKDFIIDSKNIGVSDKINLLSNTEIKFDETREMFNIDENQEKRLLKQLKDEPIRCKLDYYRSRDFVYSSTEKQIVNEIRNDMGDTMLSFTKGNENNVVEVLNCYEGLPVVELGKNGAKNLINYLERTDDYQIHGELGGLTKICCFNYNESGWKAISDRVDRAINSIIKSAENYEHWDLFTRDCEEVCQSVSDNLAGRIANNYWMTATLQENSQELLESLKEKIRTEDGRLWDILRENTGIEKEEARITLQLRVPKDTLEKNEIKKEEEISEEEIANRMKIDMKTLHDIIGAFGDRVSDFDKREEDKIDDRLL